MRGLYPDAVENLKETVYLYLENAETLGLLNGLPFKIESAIICFV